MIAVYLGDTYDVQLANLRAAWHAEPKLAWNAVKVGDANWIATLVLRGPARQTLAARWRVTLPLDRAPTLDELKDDAGDAIKPVNATARRLATYPAAFPAAGDVRISAEAEGGLGPDHKVFEVGSADGAAPVLVDGKIDQAALRAVHILGSKTPAGEIPTSGTRFQDQRGKSLTVSAFGKRVADAGGPPVPLIVTWKDIAAGTTAAQLWKRAPATIQIAPLPKATPTPPAAP